MIDLTDIYFFLCKLSATVLLISAVAFGVLMLAGVDIEHDERVLGFIAYIVAVAGVASFAMLVILLVILIIYFIWTC